MSLKYTITLFTRIIKYTDFENEVVSICVTINVIMQLGFIFRLTQSLRFYHEGTLIRSLSRVRRTRTLSFLQTWPFSRVHCWCCPEVTPKTYLLTACLRYESAYRSSQLSLRNHCQGQTQMISDRSHKETQPYQIFISE